jgi:hypothetical protein
MQAHSVCIVQRVIGWMLGLRVAALIVGLILSYHYATQGDMFGHRPTSGYCRRNMAIIPDIVLKLLHSGDRDIE